ncbi:MAG TPA: rhomboid family intramembrane serine protease [Verrucomicrobiae bacterium]|nr:rhomboid family intramembrane serine protease [Verrucomicrobiae bacterium]
MTSGESTRAVIPARSRRQAMDWSLVLLSQEIDCVIEESGNGWGLSVDSLNRDRATEILLQYRRENRGWRWQHRLPWPDFPFHSGAVMWCLLLVLFYGLSGIPSTHLETAGTLHSQAVLKGSWWQLFTAVVLHRDLAHLMANLTIGFVLLGLAMGRYGAGRGLLAAYLCGAAGNVLGVLLHAEPYRGCGASGMVMGALGLLAIQSLSFRRGRPFVAKYIVAGLSAGLMLFVLLGVGPDPATDVLAHLGGFAAGLLFGGLLTTAAGRRLSSAKNNVGAGILFGALLFLTWVLALL